MFQNLATPYLNLEVGKAGVSKLNNTNIEYHCWKRVLLNLGNTHLENFKDWKQEFECGNDYFASFKVWKRVLFTFGNIHIIPFWVVSDTIQPNVLSFWPFMQQRPHNHLGIGDAKLDFGYINCQKAGGNSRKKHPLNFMVLEAPGLYGWHLKSLCNRCADNEGVKLFGQSGIS